jgi:hypothetical protein
MLVIKSDELNSKKEIGKRDYNLLSTDGIIGFYRECELTHIYLVESSSGTIHHYFALLSYEEFLEIDETKKEERLTESLIVINKKYKLGITRMRIGKENAKDIFDQLCSGSLKFNKTNFILPKSIQLLPKTHVPTIWGDDSPILSRVLKPNFWRDRYILEFAGLEDPMSKILTADEFDKVNAEILSLIPIDLASIHDRIGSFIFQFPITLVSGNTEISPDWCKTLISITMHSDFKHQDDLCYLAKTSLDDVITGFHCYSGNQKHIELALGDSNNLELKVFNKNNGLVYTNSRQNLLKNINTTFGIGLQNSEPRIFKDSLGNEKKVNLLSFSMGAVSGESFSYDTRTKRRMFQNEIIKRSGRFLNVHAGEREKALDFVRKRIEEKAPRCSEIWLWDPYLDYKSILDALYFTSNSDVALKCITSFKKYKKRIDDQKNYSILEWFKVLLILLVNRKDESSKYNAFRRVQREGLLSSSNNRGINLEFRAAYNCNGFDFHDRFLFLIPKETDEIPTVYSLGTSISGLGKSHHLIQQTLDPRNIVETFKELWGMLDNEESKILKLPEDKK